MRNIITLVLFLLIFVGVICLQIFLSKKRNKWPGLILPSINLILSLIPTISWFQAMPHFKHYEKFDDYGNLMESVTIEPAGGMGHVIFVTLMVFLICNILTLILMAIYWVCRKKRKRQQETH